MQQNSRSDNPNTTKPSDDASSARLRLVKHLCDAGIQDQTVLEALASLPRHHFVDEAFSARAYDNTALPIGYKQTISQPFIVALMTTTLRQSERRLDKVLEIGSGSGYQTAVLAQLVSNVYSIERIEKLLAQARERLRQLGLSNVRLKHEDGHLGWPRYAPYDGIMVTAACAQIPPALLDQLAVGGRLVSPVGEPNKQELIIVERRAFGFEKQSLGPVVFVPLLGGVL